MDPHNANAVAMAQVCASPRAETMKEYVIRRAGEVKRYAWVSSKTGVNRHWLAKLAIGRIPNPNYDDIQTLHDFYKSLDGLAP